MTGSEIGAEVTMTGQGTAVAEKMGEIATVSAAAGVMPCQEHLAKSGTNLVKRPDAELALAKTTAAAVTEIMVPTPPKSTKAVSAPLHRTTDSLLHLLRRRSLPARGMNSAGLVAGVNHETAIATEIVTGVASATTLARAEVGLIASVDDPETKAATVMEAVVVVDAAQAVTTSGLDEGFDNTC